MLILGKLNDIEQYLVSIEGIQSLSLSGKQILANTNTAPPIVLFRHEYISIVQATWNSLIEAVKDNTPNLISIDDKGNVQLF